MLNKHVILFLVLGIVAVGCKDKVSVVPNPVSFEIKQPTEGELYNYGDTVFIESLVSWENELHGYEVFIKQLDNDSIVFQSHAHNDTHQLNIYKIWVNQVANNCDMQLVIKAYTSHEDRWETITRRFVCLSLK